MRSILIRYRRVILEEADSSGLSIDLSYVFLTRSLHLDIVAHVLAIRDSRSRLYLTLSRVIAPW